MATSAFWAEKVLLVLPGRDSKLGFTHEDRLKECVKLLASKKRNGRVAFLLTSEAKVSPFLQLVRTYGVSGCLAGSLVEHEWLAGCLDLIIATPLQALRYWWDGHLSDDDVKALLVDMTDMNVVGEAFQFATRFSGFAQLLPQVKVRVESSQWFSTPHHAAVSQTFATVLQSQLPEAASCPGWGDRLFVRALTTFAQGDCNIVVQDWSGVIALILGIVRGASQRGAPPLLLAPGDKLSALSRLVLACADELGVKLQVGTGNNAQIILGSLDNMSTTPHYVGSLVLVQADKLLDSASAWKVHQLVKLCLHCPIGLHFSTQTDAVTSLVRIISSMEQPCLTLPFPAVTLKGVCEFVTTVDDESEKMDRLCEIWQQLERSRGRFSIFCNNSETVDRLGDELKSRGFAVFTLHQGEELDVTMYDNPFAVLVTNVYNRGAQDVINYDCPGSYEEYVERVGKDRARQTIKVVINMVTSHDAVGFPVNHMVPLPSQCSGLHSKLPMWFQV